MLKFNAIGSEISTKGEGTGANVKNKDAFSETAKNLLKHIPGESSGFYLMAASSFTTPSTMTLGILFTLSLIILLLVRYLAKASKSIFVTTVLAFFIWMAVIDNGFIRHIIEVQFPNYEIGPWGLIIGTMYSIVITQLANSGKLN